MQKRFFGFFTSILLLFSTITYAAVPANAPFKKVFIVPLLNDPQFMQDMLELNDATSKPITGIWKNQK